MYLHRPPQHAAERGFSLVELMIAAALGMLILAGMTTLFVNNSRAQAEVEKANRQVENGRFGIQVLAGDLRNAGFYGEFDPTVLALPAALPDACAATKDELKKAMALHAQGVDNAGAGALSCLADLREGTDVLVVRHAATCVAGVGSCDPAAAGGPFLQASLCNNAGELSSSDPANFYSLEIDSASLSRHKRDCTSVPGSGTPADVRRYLTHIYFVANNDNTSDGIPTLKRAELGVSGGALSFTIVPLVEGIENLQLEYGVDNGNDGVADLFMANPASAANFRNVVSVKLNLLARNIEPSAGFTDTKTYVLGNTAAGMPNVITAPGDRYRRHVFQTLVALPNPAGRKLP